MDKWMKWAVAGAGALAGAAFGTSMAAKVKGMPVADMVAERLKEFLAGDEEPKPAPAFPTINEFDAACETLGLPKNKRSLTKAIVETAAKKFMVINHPDKFAYLGKDRETLQNRLCQYARAAADTIINSLEPGFA